MTSIQLKIKDETIQAVAGTTVTVAVISTVAYLGYNWSQVIVPLTINGYNCSLTGGGILFTVTTTALALLVREMSNFRLNF